MKSPKVVNCSARTGLDMLAKHYTEAVGFDIVFFLPDSEEDFASYNEFVRYLGDGNRVGVAKFDDGTTLFLVPASEFLTNVLNVSRLERLLKIFSCKLKTRWIGPFTINQVFPYGTAELSQTDWPNFKVNGHRFRNYFGEDIPLMVVLDFQNFPKDQ
nr:flowering time control protein FPA-like [Tanacetum cinerariifolium]